MKKVIFVGGTGYSGSTFLHMILANDPKGFSCGEANALFDPHRSHRLDLRCGCGDEDCKVWEQVLERGADNLYETIFELFPEVEFIVDSSKQPLWIQSQGENLQQKGIPAKNLLVWKTPLEFAYSCKRRDRFENWDKRWIGYHRRYFSLIDEWRAIQYRAVTSGGGALERACDYVGIPYYQGKEQYWQKTHHALGGNYSAKFHLYARDTAKDYLANSFDQERIQFYRTIYYRDVDDPALRKIVEGAAARSENLQRIQGLLEACDVAHESVDEVDLGAVQLSGALLGLRRVRNLLKTQIGRYRYGHRG